MASAETFFKNADLLRLIARKEYLPDLRDVARLASVNQRTRTVLALTPDLVLCREIHANTRPHKTCAKCFEEHPESLACNHERDERCHDCDGDLCKIGCETVRGFQYALYERGNLRVARTFGMICRENASTETEPGDRLDIAFHALLENGHFETAIECALEQENPDIDEKCGDFFFYAMATVYDKQSVDLAEQRLRETCKLMQQIPRETLNEIVRIQLRELINTHGATEKIFLLLKRVADKIGNVLLDTAKLIDYMVNCSVDLFRGGQMQTIVENNADGLAYLVRTKQSLLCEIASVLMRRVDKRLNLRNRPGKNLYNVVYYVLVLLRRMHSNECDTALEWRLFFLSTEMQAVARTMLKATAFSPLTAEMMEERDRQFRQLVAEQFKNNPNIECIDEFLEETAVRGAMDRYLEFVAARLRDGVLYRQTDAAAPESPNKRQKI